MANNRKPLTRTELRTARPQPSAPFKPIFPVPVKAVKFIDDPPPLQKPEYPGYLLLTQAEFYLSSQDGSIIEINKL
jgi:hypothetical protein